MPVVGEVRPDPEALAAMRARVAGRAARHDTTMRADPSGLRHLCGTGGVADSAAPPAAGGSPLDGGRPEY